MELILSIAPSDLLLHPFPDRCLQHTKQNLRQEAKKKDPVSGDPRLSLCLSCFLSWSALSSAQPGFQAPWSFALSGIVC